jgi:outer membrane protein OmpA-like peptidoglycan-associated protein
MHAVIGGTVSVILLLSVTAAQAVFNPPVVVRSVESAQGRLYFIDRGQDANIKIGDVLNVFREVAVRGNAEGPRHLRLQLGTMEITASETGVSLGRFTANEGIADNPLIRMKMPVKGDLVIPKLKIDSSVLFQPGSATLQGQVVQEELDKVVQFVRSFSPSRLVIEGHTDSDGDEAANQALSVQRAEMVSNYLITNYREITPQMVTAQGYGETRPLVPNDTPENRALNRRIEIVVWE